MGKFVNFVYSITHAEYNIHIFLSVAFQISLENFHLQECISFIAVFRSFATNVNQENI